MLTNNQIIVQVLQGKIQHYRHLVDKYRNMAYTIALKLMKNTDDAEEVAQESLIKAFEKLNSFKGEATFSTWLYTIVYRTDIYHLRKSTPLDNMESSHLNIVNDTINASEAIERKETKSQVKNAIDQLPRLEALIVTSLYLDEKSVDEVAQITDLTKANVKVKLFRDRKKLKTILDPVLSE